MLGTETQIRANINKTVLSNPNAVLNINILYGYCSQVRFRCEEPSFNTGKISKFKPVAKPKYYIRLGLPNSEAVANN